MECSGTARYLISLPICYREIQLFYQGIPHRLSRDDFYEGMLLPAGASITANEWWIT
jgi:hypothetical protein